MTNRLAGAAIALLWVSVLPAHGQHSPGAQGSRNIRITSHIPLSGGGQISISNTEIRSADIEMEQELSRPYVYVPMLGTPSTVHFISIKDPAKATLLHTWTIESPELHKGLGALSPTYLKTKGRYYYVNGFQFASAGPDGDLGAIVWDVTGLPNPATIKEVKRIRMPDAKGGFHETYSYKHSTGLALLFTTSTKPGNGANVFDMDKLVAGDPNQGLIANIPPGVPEVAGGAPTAGYHDFYVQYDVANKRDVFYGAGSRGYWVYDITDLKEPKLLTMSGIQFGHTFVADPTGRYGYLETEYQWAPMRIVDLKAGMESEAKNTSRAIGAWTADWNGNPHNYEIRWPYVFVAAFEDGMHVVNVMDPTNPYTVGFYDKMDKPHTPGAAGAGLVGGMPGSFGVDVRNADGLIVTSDMVSGFWAFKMEGFDGWNGKQWGIPNVSSAQDWDNGPEGAPKPQRVS